MSLLVYNSPMKGAGRGRSDGLHAIKSTPGRPHPRGGKIPIAAMLSDGNSENSENGISSSGQTRNSGLIVRQQASRRKGRGKGGNALKSLDVNKRKREEEELEGPTSEPTDVEENAAKKQKISEEVAKTTAKAPSPTKGPPIALPPPPPGPPPSLARKLPPPPPPPPAMNNRVPGPPPLPNFARASDPDTPSGTYHPCDSPKKSDLPR
jgi:hypothetical protein